MPGLGQGVQAQEWVTPIVGRPDGRPAVIESPSQVLIYRDSVCGGRTCIPSANAQVPDAVRWSFANRDGTIHRCPSSAACPPELFSAGQMTYDLRRINGLIAKTVHGPVYRMFLNPRP